MTDLQQGFQDIQQGFSWIESFTNFEKKPMESREYRLDRMIALLNLFNNPHKKRPSIHIAGSKGKGSVATLLAGALSSFGFRIGLYRSPHVQDYRERISLNGEFFPESVYISTLDNIKQSLDSHPNWIDTHGQPTTFELLTLAGFLIFFKQNCDMYVLETGLGGRLDATNVVDPLFSVITTLELEHTDILGPTLTHIAKEKAGIIKDAKPVFIFPQQEECLETLENLARSKQAPAYFPLGKLRRDFPGFTHLKLDWKGITGDYEGNTYSSCIPGVMHLTNCLFVTRILVKSIEDRLILLPKTSSQYNNQELPSIEQSILNHLAQVSIPGRMEIITPRTHRIPVPLILDGAHTPFSAQLLKHNLELLRHHPFEVSRDREIQTSITANFGLILAISQGKKIDFILETLLPIAKWLIITSPGFFKSSNPRELFLLAQEKAVDYPNVMNIYLHEQPEEALDHGLTLSEQDKIPLVITGSFYLLGEIKNRLVLRQEQDSLTRLHHGITRNRL